MGESGAAGSGGVVMTYEQELLQKVRKLNRDQQQRVLAFVDEQLTELKGTSGRDAIRIAREIGFSHDDLMEMQAAIEEGCEVIEDFPEVDLDG
jgi:hypothetical protein